MKFSKKTLDILKNFSQINNSILFREGQEQRTVSQSGNIFATANIEEDFPKEAGIYDLSEFLNTLSLFDDPEIVFGDKQFTITDATTSCRYSYAPKNVIIFTDKRPKFNGSNVEFSLGAEVLGKIQRASSVMDLSDLVVSLDGNDLVLSASDTQTDTTNTYDVVVGEHTNDSDEVNFIFKSENLKVLPGDYEVSVKSPAGRFVGDDVEYYIAIEHASTFVEG